MRRVDLLGKPVPGATALTRDKVGRTAYQRRPRGCTEIAEMYAFCLGLFLLMDACHNIDTLYSPRRGSWNPHSPGGSHRLFRTIDPSIHSGTACWKGPHLPAPIGRASADSIFTVVHHNRGRKAHVCLRFTVEQAETVHSKRR